MSDGLCCPESDPSPCFKCKLAYWRTKGAPFQYTWGREMFHESTDAERGRNTKAYVAEQLGYEPIPYEE